MENSVLYLKELSYLQTTVLWTIIIAVANAFSAIFFLLTAAFAIATYLKLKNRDRLNMTSKLFDEFTKLHVDIFDMLSNEEATIQKNDENNKKSYRLILFLSKLGNFLLNKKMTFEDLKVFFYSHLFYRDSILILINNLRIFNPKLLKQVRESLNFLFNEIYQKEQIIEFNNLIYENFEELKKKEFKKILDGNLTFSGDLSIKIITAEENYKILSEEFIKQLNGEYNLVMISDN